MKTAMIARFVLGAGAIFAVAGLAGCGAETGQGAEGVGESKAALQNTNPSDTTGLSLSNLDLDLSNGVIDAPTGLKFAATCAIHDATANKDYFAIAGGYNPATGAASNDIWVFEPTAPSWKSLKALTPSVHLTNARLDLAGLQMPGDTSKCVFVGGSATPLGAGLADVDELHVNNGTWNVAARTSLGTGRSRLGLSACTGGSKFVAVGGQSSGTPIKTIEVSNSYAPTAWDLYNAGAQQLGRQRYDFAFAKDSGGDQYLVAGGHSNISAQDATLEVIKTATTVIGGVSRTCVPAVTTFFGVHDPILANGVEGNVAFLEGTTTTMPAVTTDFIVVGGKDSTSATPKDQDRVTVTWAPPAIAIASTANVLAAGVYRSSLTSKIPDAGQADAYMLVGGSDGAVTTARNNVQQYQSGFGWHFTTLTNARYAAVAEYVAGKVYSATGTAFGTPETFPLSLEVITP